MKKNNTGILSGRTGKATANAQEKNRKKAAGTLTIGQHQFPAGHKENTTVEREQNHQRITFGNLLLQLIADQQARLRVVLVE